jgi:hypothetical protein
MCVVCDFCAATKTYPIKLPGDDMNKDILETLSELRRHLDELEPIDDQQRHALQASLQEIQVSLDRNDVKSSSLAKSFHESTEEFSDNHPLLTRTAGQIADMLAQMGI